MSVWMLGDMAYIYMKITFIFYEMFSIFDVAY
jgi:hypothetical protein